MHELLYERKVWVRKQGQQEKGVSSFIRLCSRADRDPQASSCARNTSMEEWHGGGLPRPAGALIDPCQVKKESNALSWQACVLLWAVPDFMFMEAVDGISPSLRAFSIGMRLAQACTSLAVRLSVHLPSLLSANRCWQMDSSRPSIFYFGALSCSPPYPP